MSKVKEAVSCFTEGFLCSQAIFSTYAPEIGLDRETALKISCSFGGGMARMGETCGAVTGALMVIGLKSGNTNVDDKQGKERTYGVAWDFVSRFTQCNDSIKCKDLLCCDISTTEGAKIANEKQLFTTLCPKFVEDAALIIEQILDIK
ncbi:C_GCAxxG_C_C family probable redox protein [Desulfosporosinus orientis DSM 765]|uniref:C_GCAxxG_C_C family probable redox protein n=1 Tax=Desulfosporosinus orientis (strain ATCC 19365 / DSM 765 / NCIMB 8382 / VKM B-1628 / Singapore I) TaxID=768706 RepID=G7WBF2_DESOD|nr:C-GCAxxG-C-C family protein [Desulfosporosinus orientis]AET68281.1 C_GCAxxG_C_C family probable redox protein [Desulfosporosinus orientis DSM 765]